MNLPEIGRIASQLTPVSTNALTRSWMVGQILEASVIERDADGLLRLRIGNDFIDARSTLPLSTGQSLTVQVTHTGEQTILRVVPDTTAESAATQGWRQALPRQTDMQPAMNDILKLANEAASNSASTTGARLSPPLTTLLRSFVENLPTLHIFSRPDAFRQAVLDSGLFLEAKLAAAANSNQAPVLASDIKLGLLRLQQQLAADYPQTAHAATRTIRPDTAEVLAQASTLPPDSASRLAHSVDAALARTLTNQLSSLPTDPSTPTAWVIDLPLRGEHGSETVKLRIERENRGGEDDAAQPWSVWLSLDLGVHGAVNAHVGVTDVQVGVQFWAERPPTTQLFNARMPELETKLAEQGLTPTRLDCRTGTGPQVVTPQPPDGLLDERV